MEFGAFLGHSWLKVHPWQAVPDLPCPLASLWSHPGKVSAEKDKCKCCRTVFAQHQKLGTTSSWWTFWTFLVEISPLTGSSQPTTSPGQPLEPSWKGQCWKTHKWKSCGTVQHHNLGTTTSWWTCVDFIAIPGFWITLCRLFLTNHNSWSAFGAILDRSVMGEAES